MSAMHFVIVCESGKAPRLYAGHPDFARIMLRVSTDFGATRMSSKGLRLDFEKLGTRIFVNLAPFVPQGTERDTIIRVLRDDQ